MAGTSKSKVIHATTLSASDLKELEFALRHPFVEVVDGLVSKFQDGKKLDPEVCNFFLRKVMGQMEDFGNCYSLGGPITQELHYRPVACSMLPAFTRLAPKAGETLTGEDSKYEQDDALVGFEHTPTEVVMEDVDGNSNSILATSFMSDDSALSGWSFSDGCFRHEDGTTLKPHEAVNCRGYVFDARSEVPYLPRSIFEMKALDLWPIVAYQAIYCGCGAAMQNTKAGRFKKVYVVVMGIGWAGVAEIDPIGYLEVTQKNVISPASAASFREQVERKCAFLEQKKKSEQSRKLRQKYLQKTDTELAMDMQAEMRNRMGKTVKGLNSTAKPGVQYSPTFNIDPTNILVGTATYRGLSYKMMKYPLHERAEVEADRIVISGIARIIYGDRSLKWTLSQVEELDRKRQTAMDLKVAMVMSR